MKYRKLGRLDVDVPALGLGCMRLPLLETAKSITDFHERQKAVDEEKALALINYAIAEGITYFDTAYMYHAGRSEVILGKAVRNCRKAVMLTTKCPIQMVETTADFDRILDEQLTRLDTDYIDFYLLHGLGRITWQKGNDLGILPFLDKIMTDGRAKKVGFSFHDDKNVFKEIIDAYDWSLCQIQYNYYDENYQAGRDGLEYAASKGIGVVIMEPLRGGRLTDKIPPEVQRIWDQATPQRTPAEWGLRWLWNQPEVSMVLSGMTTMAQLKENLSIADTALPNSLSASDGEILQRVADAYRRLLGVDCTACGYCMPCPNEVDIPMNFTLYNDACMFNDSEINTMVYNNMMPPTHRASNCQECGECEPKCPQQIKIVETLKLVNERLASKQ